MFVKKIKYTDFNGVEREEEFMFHLSKAEVLEMEMGVEGGMTALLNRIIAAKSQPKLIKYFKDFITKSYGVISDDGRSFVKNKELTDAFTQTEAYSMLFMELATDDKKAAEFVNGVMPKNMGDNQPKDHQKPNPIPPQAR